MILKKSLTKHLNKLKKKESTHGKNSTLEKTKKSTRSLMIFLMSGLIPE